MGNCCFHIDTLQVMTVLISFSFQKVCAQLSCHSGYLLPRILGKAGCQMLVLDKSSDRTVYGNVGIFLVDRCTDLPFCRRLGRQPVLERAMDCTHSKKGLKDSSRGQLAAHLSSHAKLLVAVSSFSFMRY